MLVNGTYGGWVLFLVPLFLASSVLDDGCEGGLKS